MKSQLTKLRGLALNKHGTKEESLPRDADEHASSDVEAYAQTLENMRTRFEVFLTNGQLISGAAYDFSSALTEMASCMIGTFGEMLDDKIGETFRMLANVQFEIAKLLELFTKHVCQSIISPSERIISEISKIEDIKDKYYENQRVYDDFWMEKHREKPKKGKENYPDEQFILAKKSMKEQFNAIQHRTKSLVQGQSACLFNQVVLYHMIQMHFFSKGLETVNAMEPVMKQLAEEARVDRSLLLEQMESGRLAISNDELPKSEVGTNTFASLLSQELSTSSTKVKFTPVEPQRSSKSAPLVASAYSRKVRDTNVIQGIDEQISGYALPSPVEVKNSLATCSTVQEANTATRVVTSKMDLVNHNKSYGLYVEQNVKDTITEVGGLCCLTAPLKSSPSIYKSNPLPRWGNKIGHVQDHIVPQHKSEPVQASACSTTNSSPLSIHPPAMVSSPLIFELHKLPPPPQPGSATAHSAPLGQRRQESQLKIGPASPLPPPPPSPPPLARVMTRSLSASSAHYSQEYFASVSDNLDSTTSSCI